jgi:hypothetical protein
VEFELRLDAALAAIPDLAAFAVEVERDVARAAGVAASRVSALAVRAGSVVVDMALLPAPADPTGQEALAAVRDLEEQARDPASQLRQGLHTARTLSLRRKAGPGFESQSPAREGQVFPPPPVPPRLNLVRPVCVVGEGPGRGLGLRASAS